jgi:hypothetical protein
LVAPDLSTNTSHDRSGRGGLLSVGSATNQMIAAASPMTRIRSGTRGLGSLERSLVRAAPCSACLAADTFDGSARTGVGSCPVWVGRQTHRLKGRPPGQRGVRQSPGKDFRAAPYASDAAHARAGVSTAGVKTRGRPGVWLPPPTPPPAARSGARSAIGARACTQREPFPFAPDVFAEEGRRIGPSQPRRSRPTEAPATGRCAVRGARRVRVEAAVPTSSWWRAMLATGNGRAP